MRAGYADEPCVTVTPAVEVVSVAVIADSLLHPLFFNGTLIITHSLALTIPLLFPSIESLTVTPLTWRFDAPVMQKFCVVVDPPVATTETVAGDDVEQLRSASEALAVYVPAGTEIE